MGNPNRVGMPTAGQIARYWREHQAGTSMKWPVNPIYCFACGWESQLERAHIKAIVDGGDNSAGNIHLLCKPCHVVSEALDGERYWRWMEYKQTNQYDVYGWFHMRSYAYAMGATDIDNKGFKL